MSLCSHLDFHLPQDYFGVSHGPVSLVLMFVNDIHYAGDDYKHRAKSPQECFMPLDSKRFFKSLCEDNWFLRKSVDMWMGGVSSVLYLAHVYPLIWSLLEWVKQIKQSDKFQQGEWKTILISSVGRAHGLDIE